MNIIFDEDYNGNKIQVISKSVGTIPNLFEKFPTLRETILENIAINDVIVFCTRDIRVIPEEVRVFEQYFDDIDHVEGFLRWRYYDVLLKDKTWVVSKLGFSNIWHCMPLMELYDNTAEYLLTFLPQYFVTALCKSLILEF